MNVHCTYCRHSFNLSRDYLTQAVAEAAEKNHKSHSLECPSCRKTVKISVKQMQRFVPRQQDSEQAGE
ncbi:MAG: hypothetical protein H6658_14840 [Ardenticatenaceae bacterium]|nr:hypothetical protein [Ardenticatenaceae bacterium]